MEKISNSAKRMIARAQKIKDPSLREKKIKDARKSSWASRRDQ